MKSVFKKLYTAMLFLLLFLSLFIAYSIYKHRFVFFKNKEKKFTQEVLEVYSNPIFDSLMNNLAEKYSIRTGKKIEITFSNNEDFNQIFKLLNKDNSVLIAGYNITTQNKNTIKPDELYNLTEFYQTHISAYTNNIIEDLKLELKNMAQLLGTFSLKQKQIYISEEAFYNASEFLKQTFEKDKERTCGFVVDKIITQDIEYENLSSFLKRNKGYIYIDYESRHKNEKISEFKCPDLPTVSLYTSQSLALDSSSVFSLISDVKLKNLNIIVSSDMDAKKVKEGWIKTCHAYFDKIYSSAIVIKKEDFRGKDGLIIDFNHDNTRPASYKVFKSQTPFVFEMSCANNAFNSEQCSDFLYYISHDYEAKKTIEEYKSFF